MPRRLRTALFAKPAGAISHVVFDAGTLEPALPDDVRERVASNPKLWLDEDGEGPWSPSGSDAKLGDEVRDLEARFAADPSALKVEELLRLADLRGDDRVKTSMRKDEMVETLGGLTLD